MRYRYLFGFLVLVISLAGSPVLAQNYILANDRLTVIPPSGDMQVATSNDLVLHVTNDAVLKVIVSWKSLDGDRAPEDAREEQQAIMTFGAGGQAVIGVHPPMAGLLAMSVEVDFQDARYAVANEVVNAKIPTRKPKTLELSDVTDAKATVVNLDLGAHKSARLKGIATYSGYEFPVDVSADHLKFAVQPAQSPIELDPVTGIVIARSYGTAMVRAKLGGHGADVCVVVSKDTQDANGANCSGPS